MNILIDTLPDEIEVAGQMYKVRSEYRTCLNIILAFEDNNLTIREKYEVLITLLYDDVPKDKSEALKQGMIFLNGGKVNKGEGIEGLRVYSFSQDANYIYAAFRQTHGIDLQTASLHWWQFMALFMDLGADTLFCNLVGLRSRIYKGTASKEDKQLADEMEDIFELPEIDTRTLEEKEADEIFMNMIRPKGK